MVEQYNKVGGNLVAVMDVPREDTSKYGILDIKADHGQLVEIKGLVEKPKPEAAPSTLSIIGRYILQPEVFQHLDAFETGAGGEIQITDAMAKLIGKQAFHGFRYEGTRFDCGSRLGFIEATMAYGMRDPEIGGQVTELLKKYGKA
jgi:UTP--glucose-1-phosphate uridylyltransferase